MMKVSIQFFWFHFTWFNNFLQRFFDCFFIMIYDSFAFFTCVRLVVCITKDINFISFYCLFIFFGEGWGSNRNGHCNYRRRHRHSCIILSWCFIEHGANVIFRVKHHAFYNLRLDYYKIQF